MSTRIKFYCILGVIVVFGILISVFFLPMYSNDEGTKPILIGHASPLTGDNAYIGHDQLRGAKLAVEVLNRSGGILGRRVELVIEDDQGKSATAVNVAQKFCLNENIIGVVGHLNSHCSISAAPVYGRHNLSMLTPVSTSDKLTTMKLNNIFRLCIRNSDQAPALAKYCIKNGFSKFAIIHDNRDYGKDLADQFKRLVSNEAPNVQVVSEEVISTNNSNYRTVLTKIKAKKPEVIFVGAMAREAALLMIQSKEIGLDVIFVGGDGIFSNELIERGGNAAEGTIVSHIAPMRGEGVHNQEFFSLYNSKYNEQVRAYAPLAYDCVMVLAKAIEYAKIPDRARIIEVLHRDDFTYKGLTGEISFDRIGERLSRKPYLYEIYNGQFISVDIERK